MESLQILLTFSTAQIISTLSACLWLQEWALLCHLGAVWAWASHWTSLVPIFWTRQREKKGVASGTPSVSKHSDQSFQEESWETERWVGRGKSGPTCSTSWTGGSIFDSYCGLFKFPLARQPGLYLLHTNTYVVFTARVRALILSFFIEQIFY